MEESSEPGGATTPSEPAAIATTPTEGWRCRNDLEISCDAESCDAADAFTPMDVRVDDGGSMSVCAYSGCWEGAGTVVKSDAFIVITGHDLPFSTAPDSVERQADILIALDKADDVAVLKAGPFAHPLRCEKDPAVP